ncbi:MAG: Mpo1-like protein [Elusimicrobiota bacterium]
MGPKNKFGNLGEFWPFYISQHTRRATRRLHFAGTTLGLACAAVAVVTGRLWFLLAALVVSYGLAWIGHFFIEKNLPATFQYPALSLRADLRMYRLMMMRVMDSEIIRHREKIAEYLAG